MSEKREFKPAGKLQVVLSRPMQLTNDEVTAGEGSVVGEIIADEKLGPIWLADGIRNGMLKIVETEAPQRATRKKADSE